MSLKGNDRGVILAQGGKFGGWALYMNNGKPAYTYNYFGLKSYTVESSRKISSSNAEIKLEFTYDGNGNGKGGLAKIFVDGKQVTKGRIDKTQPLLFSADETADAGKDDATQVANNVFKDVKDSDFTGHVNKIMISIPNK